MFIKILLYLSINYFLCSATNVLNILDFAAPIFQIYNGQTPEVCYDGLGCFRNDGVFSTSRVRPISVVPQPPEFIGTKYTFFSPKNPNEPKEFSAINVNEFSEIDFDPSLNTLIIIHGFKEGIIFGEWQQSMIEVVKDGLLSSQHSNVFVVHWGLGAMGFYFQAVANCRVVGVQVSQLINYLISEKNAKPERFHMIGFSLGAHISGYVGQRVANLGRITALDAAKPYFDGLSTDIRLDPSDALFVDALHTDNGIGTAESVGHIDIFVNNGNSQPGCRREMNEALVERGFFEALSEIISCDHKRALDYYQDFIFSDNRNCRPIAYRCENWDKFLSGFCTKCGQYGQDCAFAGPYTNLNQYKKSNSKFYMITNDREPYCVFQYLVTIISHTTSDQLNGKFSIKLKFSDTSLQIESRNIQLTNKNIETSFVISSDRQLDQIEKLNLNFIKKKFFIFDVQSILRIHTLKLTPLNIIDDQAKEMNTKIYCNEDNDWVLMKNEIGITFDRKYCLI